MATDTTNRRLVTIVLVVLAALILLPTLGMTVGMMGYGPMGGMWGHGGGMWGGGMWGDGMWGDGGAASGWVLLIGVVMQLLFLAAIVLAGYLVYRALTRSGGGTDQALEELRLAYARGDLSDEEYEQRRENLQRGER